MARLCVMRDPSCFIYQAPPLMLQARTLRLVFVLFLTELLCFIKVDQEVNIFQRDSSSSSFFLAPSTSHLLLSKLFYAWTLELRAGVGGFVTQMGHPSTTKCSGPLNTHPSWKFDLELSQKVKCNTSLFWESFCSSYIMGQEPKLPLYVGPAQSGPPLHGWP